MVEPLLLHTQQCYGSGCSSNSSARISSCVCCSNSSV